MKKALFAVLAVCIMLFSNNPEAKAITISGSLFQSKFVVTAAMGSAEISWYVVMNTDPNYVITKRDVRAPQTALTAEFPISDSTRQYYIHAVSVDKRGSMSATVHLTIPMPSMKKKN